MKQGKLGGLASWGSLAAGFAAVGFILAGCSAMPVSAQSPGEPSVAEARVDVEAHTPRVWEHGMPAWAAEVTDGGRGGRVIRVTNLDAEGPGSLREAIEAEGARIIVFEVGGVIDLGKSTLLVRNSDMTIAGQTAPSPGITLVRGGIDIHANDVIIQHLRIRPGDVGEGRGTGWGEDAISTRSAHRIIVDHCTLTWATDENLSASGPRFTGDTPAEWRDGTSRDLVYSYNLVAEGLADSTHPKFEHSKGSLIHDNITNITIYANLYAHNYERNPLFKGGVHGAVVNNFIYNPGPRAAHYNLQGLEWGDVPYETGRMDLVGNVLRGGPDTPEGLPLFILGGDGDIELHADGNIAVDRWGNELPRRGRNSTGRAEIIEQASPMGIPDGLSAIPARDVEKFVLANAGARPWDRDGHDVRVFADVAEGRGMIIDSQDEVGGYPTMAATRRAFDPAEWDMATMAPRTAAAIDSAAQARGT